MRKLVTGCMLLLSSITLSAQKQFEHLSPTKENILTVLSHHGIKHPKYVLAQAIQECGLKTGSHNNLFGLRHRRGYYTFKHWSYSVEMYKDKIQSRYRDGENYLSFLKRIRYAESPNYTSRIRSISARL